MREDHHYEVIVEMILDVVVDNKRIINRFVRDNTPHVDIVSGEGSIVSRRIKKVASIKNKGAITKDSEPTTPTYWDQW